MEAAVEDSRFHTLLTGCQFGCGGGATTNDTIRRTSGNTASSVGNATSQDIAHAAGQVARNAGVGPRLFSVEMADTTNVIRMDKTSGMTTGAQRAGSFRTANMLLLFGNSGRSITKFQGIAHRSRP